MTQAVAPVRYSSQLQRGGYSFELQEHAILQRADALGCDHVEFFRDAATSAKKKGASEWTGMGQLIDYVKTHEVDYLIYYLEDRLTRQGDDFFLDVYPLIQKYAPHCKMVNASDGSILDPYSPEGVLRIARGIDDNDKRSKRAFGTQLAMLKRGELPGKRPNYGYQFDSEEKTLDVVESTARVVQFIFHLASWGYSFQFIADTLNDAQIPSPSKQIWLKGSVQALIRNAVYVGTVSWGFDVFHQVHQDTLQSYLTKIHIHPIVSQYVWFRANDLSSDNPKAYKMDTPFLFRDLLWCKSCNKKLATKNTSSRGAKSQSRVYTCPHCNKKVGIESLHKVLVTEIQQDFYPQLFPCAPKVKEIFSKLRTELAHQIKELKHHCLELEAKVRDVESSDAPEWRALEICTRKLEQTRNVAERIESMSSDPTYYHTVESWGVLDFFGLTQVELRRLLIEVVESITVDLNGKTVPKISYAPLPGISLEVM